MPEYTTVYLSIHLLKDAFQVVLVVKNLPTKPGDMKRHGFDPWVGSIYWRREWQPTPVFLPGESHGQRGMVGYIVHGFTKSQTQLKRLSTEGYFNCFPVWAVMNRAAKSCICRFLWRQKISFPLEKYQGSKLLDYTVRVCLVL